MTPAFVFTPADLISPIIIFCCALVLPLLLTWLRLRVRGWQWNEGLRLAVLWVVCIYAASPFITECAIGTAESYNYSHAVADTIEQMRAGNFPVYVGQSEFAFNSRVHPLRTAVYYTHAAGVLDFATAHRLTFWQVQNLSLAFSILAAGFVTYACLKRMTGLPPWGACLLAGWYASCPALMAAAHGIELYMTVTAAPFLPLAVWGAMRSVDLPRASAFLAMATGLAGTWLAHPPVAAWGTLACGLVVLMGFLTRLPRLDAVTGLLTATFLGVLLSGWAFASTLTLSGGERLVMENVAWNRNLMTVEILKVTQSVGWSAFRPIQERIAALGNFQLGYAGWGFCLIGIWTAVCTRSRVAMGLLAAMACLLALTLPVPVLHAWLWRTMPTDFSAMTNIWPMQRSYLVLSALAVVLAGAGWHALAGAMQKPLLRRAGLVAGALLIPWTLWQTGLFLRQGFANRHSVEESARMHRPSNRLLIQSNFLLGLPDSHRSGTRDPAMEMRLLSYLGGPRVLADNSAKSPQPLVRQSGVLQVSKDNPKNIWRMDPTLQLEPHRRYRLHLHFLIPPFEGLLVVTGSHGLYREIQLKDPESKRGFGMLSGQSPTLPLWSDADELEAVRLALIPVAPRAADVETFATFELEEIVPASLPIRVAAWVPHLRCDIDSPTDGWLETPRMWVPGYVATVDGERVYPRKGLDGLTLVPVPAGRHTVELRYEPPSILSITAHVSLVSWSLLLVAFVVTDTRRILNKGTRATPAALVLLTRCAPALAGVSLATLAVTGLWWRSRADIAPSAAAFQMQLALPMSAPGRNEPLLASGQGPGSTIIFLRHLDNETIQFGLDVWGAGARLGPPLKLDFRIPVTVTISSGTLLSDPAASMDEQQLAWLQRHTLVQVEGQEALYVEHEKPSATLGRFTVGTNRTGSGSVEPRFTGQILGVVPLPVSASGVPFPSAKHLAEDAGPLRLTLQLPAGQTGRSEPLMTIGSGTEAVGIFIHYLDANTIRLGIEGPSIPLRFSAPFHHSFTQPLCVEVSHAALYPQRHPALNDYSPLQAARLRNKLTVGLPGRRLLAALLNPTTNNAPHTIAFGLNPGIASYPAEKFTGRLLGVERLAAPAWPVPPGRPEAAVAAGTYGPVELTVLFPIDAPNRVQPLLTTGRTGEGTIVMVHYFDDTHIRVGADIWAKALFWTDPIPVDYAAPHQIVISSAALARAAESSTTPLSVSIDGKTVLSEPIFTYTTTPEQITPGESRIGGSFAEAFFTGDMLRVERLRQSPATSRDRH